MRKDIALIIALALSAIALKCFPQSEYQPYYKQRLVHATRADSEYKVDINPNTDFWKVQNALYKANQPEKEKPAPKQMKKKAGKVPNEKSKFQKNHTIKKEKITTGTESPLDIAKLNAKKKEEITEQAFQSLDKQLELLEAMYPEDEFNPEAELDQIADDGKTIKVKKGWFRLW